MHVWYVFFRSSPNRFINCILNRSVLIGFEEMLHFLNRNDGGGNKKRGSLNSYKGKGKHCYQLHLLKKVV